MKSELLLPVGDLSMLHAAIHHGADAVYMGVPYFNARGRTTDFSLNELKEMIDLAHLYGVKVNLAFNVVIFQEEISKVVELLKNIIPMHPDSFIVQDLGLACIIRAMAPHQNIHASTQMTITNVEAIKLLADLNINRFVLGRENSLSEIKLIRQSTDKELEVFVHGALCVAYSGQCFTSESIGGRSANRGQCAQSCRLPYDLYVDDQKRDLYDKKYLVSPKDLMGLEEIPTLVNLGVNSFKVEGRLKTPEYVAAAAKNYREVLDGQKINLEKSTRELSVTYSRGFYSGWLNGVNHQKLVDGTYSAHRGIKLGLIKEVKKNKFYIDTSYTLSPGQGLLFVDEKESGGKIFNSSKTSLGWEVELLQKDLILKRNMKVYLNSDEHIEKELQKNWKHKDAMKKIPVKILVNGKQDEKLKVIMVDPEGRTATAESRSALQASKNCPITADFIFEELSRLGGSVYELNDKHILIDNELFLPHKEIKEIKQTLIKNLNHLRINPPTKTLINNEPQIFSHKTETTTRLNILLRSKEQVEGFVISYKNAFFNGLEDKIGYVILDFEYGRDYEQSLQLIKSASLKSGIATTRILKPMEYNNLKLILHLNPDVILIRNLGALEFFRNQTSIPLLGDFSLNMTNAYTHNYLMHKGLQSICCSYDLNENQLISLLKSSDPGTLEVTIHQYMPEFHMEHCVFAATLSNGSSFKDCGRPCEKYQVKLKDMYGNWHYLKADHECRNTFYKATPQSASFLIPKLLEQKVSAIRIEALNENIIELNEKIKTYLKLLHQKISVAEALDNLKIHESYGLGTGQLQKKDDYINRKNKLTL